MHSSNITNNMIVAAPQRPITKAATPSAKVTRHSSLSDLLCDLLSAFFD